MSSTLPPPVWFLFEVRVSVLLEFLERKTGRTFSAAPEDPTEANRWHLAIRKGLRSHLHLNLGIPDIETPAHPIEENACALHAALLMGHRSIEIILSGEWHLAVSEGLITKAQLKAHEAALRAAFPDEES